MCANPIYGLQRPAVVFDLGNVVLKFDHLRTCRRLAARYGLSADAIYKGIFGGGHERAFDLGSTSPKEFTEACSRELGVKLDLDEFRTAWEDIFWENQPIVRLLHEIRGATDLILLSNTNRWHFEFAERTFDVLKLFDKYVLSYEVGARKPDRRIFDEVTKLVKPESALFIDDILENVSAAEACGLRAIQYIETSTVEQIVRLHASRGNR